MKNNKKEIIIFIIIFLLSLMIFSNYLKVHYANDTYVIYNTGYIRYAITIFFRGGRPFSCLLLIIAEILNLSIETLTLISTIIGLFISCLSVMLIRRIINNFKQTQNIFEDIIITIIAYCTVYNFMYIEMLHFIETSIMTLGVFMAILAAYQLINEKQSKVLKSFALLLVAIFSYNGVAGVYILTVVLLTLLYNRKFKEFLIDVSLAAVLLMIAIALNYVQIQIINSYLNIEGSRISLDIFTNIRYTVSNIGNVLWGKYRQLFPEGLFLTFLFGVLGIYILYIIKRKRIDIIRIIVLVIFGLLSSFSMHIFSLSSFGAGRIHVSIGMTIGYLFTMIYITTDMFNTKKLTNFLIEIILCMYLIANIINFYILTRDHLIVNNLDKIQVQEISKYINEYEYENNIEVKYVTMVYMGSNRKAYYKRINGINGLGLYTEWSFDGVINFYSGRNLERIDSTSELYEEYIKQSNKDDEFLCIDNILVCPVYVV